jgi:hypothetical protein
MWHAMQLMRPIQKLNAAEMKISRDNNLVTIKPINMRFTQLSFQCGYARTFPHTFQEILRGKAGYLNKEPLTLVPTASSVADARTQGGDSLNKLRPKGCGGVVNGATGELGRAYVSLRSKDWLTGKSCVTPTASLVGAQGSSPICIEGL